MLVAFYIDGELFLKAKIFQGEDLFINFVEEYECNHLGEVAISFYNDEDGDKNCSIQFDSYDSYLRFEDAVNNEE